MRTLVLIGVLLVPLVTGGFASADPPIGQVEVTNLPDVQDVNIVDGGTNSCEVKTFQLVGFTSTAYTGNLGGVFGSTQKCQLEFSGRYYRKLWIERPVS